MSMRTGAYGGVEYVRLSQVTYPDDREVHYGYGTTQAIDDVMSRLATIGDAREDPCVLQVPARAGSSKRTTRTSR